MDEEKVSGVTIRISTDTSDRRCVYLLFRSSHPYVLDRWKAVFSKALIRPFRLFIYEPIVQLLGLYMAFVYGLLYCTHSESSQVVCYLTCLSIYHDDTFDLPRRVSRPGGHFWPALPRTWCRPYGRITNQRENNRPGIRFVEISQWRSWKARI